MIDFSSTSNFLEPTFFIDSSSIELSQSLNHDALYRLFSQFYNVHKDEVFLSTTRTSAIYTLLNYLKLHQEIQTIFLYTPLQEEYMKVLNFFDYEVVILDDITDMENKIGKETLLFFTNPNFLDGKYHDINMLMATWIKKEVTLFIDESLLAYSVKTSAKEHINRYKKLFIFKSLHQFYQSEGVKIVTLLSHQENISQLKAFSFELEFSNFDIIYTQKILEDKNFGKVSRAIYAKNMILLKNILNQSSLIHRVYESDTNFFLLSLHTIKAENLKSSLEKFGIKILAISLNNLEGEYVRITAKSESNIHTLQKALALIEGETN